VNERKLETALLHVADDPLAVPKPALPSAKPAAGKPHGGKLLLVEDNLINQKVAALCLRRLGFEVVTASNGKTAIEAVGQTRFAAILMDCHMPVMDGYEATMRIRELSNGDVPIIAMTGASHEKERKRCTDAGMNDHLVKPVNPETLARMLDKWVPLPLMTRELDRDQGKENEMSERDSILDRGVLTSLRELGGEEDPGLFVELVNLFLEDTPERMRELSAALEKQDPRAIEHAAHALKSSAANLGALGLSDLFRAIESAGREKDLGRAATLVAKALPEFGKVEAALRSEIR